MTNPLIREQIERETYDVLRSWERYGYTFLTEWGAHECPLSPVPFEALVFAVVALHGYEPEMVQRAVWALETDGHVRSTRDVPRAGQWQLPNGRIIEIKVDRNGGSKQQGSARKAALTITLGGAFTDDQYADSDGKFKCYTVEPLEEEEGDEVPKKPEGTPTETRTAQRSEPSPHPQSPGSEAACSADRPLIRLSEFAKRIHRTKSAVAKAMHSIPYSPKPAARAKTSGQPDLYDWDEMRAFGIRQWSIDIGPPPRTHENRP